MQTLGERLRELREKRGISLRNLAARVRITAPYLSDIELNRRHPDGPRYVVTTGMLHSRPFIAEAIADLLRGRDA